MKINIMLILLFGLVLLFVGCSQSNTLDIDVATEADIEEQVVEEAVEEMIEEPVVEQTTSSGLQAVQDTEPYEGTCIKVAVQWAGCDKIDNSDTNLLISMLNGGKGELPGFWIYYKMNEGNWIYQEYKMTVLFNTTSTFPIDIGPVESMNNGITKIYIYPEQEVDGKMTVCKSLPIGVFIPDRNCKGVTSMN